ncbi:hypothetical protein Vau01_092420 [Virgisporangium aurantiacum]|uniref:SseB protein N-terminal domain-containing protein n=1 Tax=Virgisporangium aurantiacum TaxID=175570 RepID=A0A8J3ZD28_9ACTN|nr:hypothetical protein Vau01_092420 [Virgisporangium aurantiacum]
MIDTDPGRSAAFARGFGDEREQAAPFVPAPGPVRPSMPDQGWADQAQPDQGWADPGRPDQGRPDQDWAAQGPATVGAGHGSPEGFGAEPSALGAFRSDPGSVAERPAGYEPGLRAAQRPAEVGPEVAPRAFDGEAATVSAERPPPPAFQPVRRDPAFADPSVGAEEQGSAPADSGDVDPDAWPATRTGPALDAEPAMGLGLGARLAALQAQSGGFVVITPDETAEEAPTGTARGIWDPKVPGVPAELDEDETSPGETLTPSPIEADLDVDPEPARAPEPEPEPVVWNYADFPPANTTEEELLEATRSNTSNQMLSTLLLAKVLIQGYSADPAHWPTEEIKGNRYLVAFTSMQRMTAHYEATLPEPEPVRFTTVIAKWPTEEIGFALNPGTPMGRLLGGSEVRGLARSAAEFGLIDADALVAVADAEEASAQTQLIPEKKAAPAPAGSDQPMLMQRTIAAAQVSMYLERGYDRVCGFVHRAGELSHLSKPADLYRALGLVYKDSPFGLDDAEVYVLRWPAHLLSLYRIPYGGQTEEALNAMQGWMIERAPFRGNGFAPSETGDVVSEFKMDSTRLPHGAQLWRLNSDGIETLVALFDADGTRWRRIGSGES